jgi:rare lipoprotein A
MRLAIIFILSISVISCSYSSRPYIQDSAPKRPIDIASVPDAIPKVEPVTRAGNPPTYRVLGKNYRLMSSSKGYTERGIASWYGTKFHGNKTSNGERYDMYAMTAAHKTIPIPAYLKVTNLKNQRSVIVRVNDRGPFHENRIIDLSYTAASKLGILRTGTGFVEIEAIDPLAPQRRKKPVNDPQLSLAPDEIYLQVGAFGQQTNAQKLTAKIHAHGIPDVRIQEDNNKPTPIYRVQIGPLISTNEADSVTKKLLQLDLTETHLVVKQIEKSPAQSPQL